MSNAKADIILHNADVLDVRSLDQLTFISPSIMYRHISLALTHSLCAVDRRTLRAGRDGPVEEG
jgi:hypothetical protein